MQPRVCHNPNTAQAISDRDCKSQCSQKRLNDCVKCLAHDLTTREGIELKEPLVIQYVRANKAFPGTHLRV